MKKFSSEDLKKFYFSKASDYDIFAAAAAMQTSQKNIQKPAAVSGSPLGSSLDNSSNTNTISLPAGSAFSAAKSGKDILVTNARKDGNDEATVSPAYIHFLKQQQELLKMHTEIDNMLKCLDSTVKDDKEFMDDSCKRAIDLLHQTEESTDWRWKSKFNQDALTRDAGLEVSVDQLWSIESQPDAGPLEHRKQILGTLRQHYCVGSSEGKGDEKKSILAEVFKPTVENSIRRFDRIIKEFIRSQMNSSDVAQIADNMLVQFDYLLSHKKLADIVTEIDHRITFLREKYKECARNYERVYEEGIMHAAEKESEGLAGLGEELCAAQVEKIQILQRVVDTIFANMKLKETYQQKGDDDIDAMQKRAQNIRETCQRDLARLFSVKEKVDDVEKTFLERTEKERAEGDLRIRSFLEKINELWDQVSTLLQMIIQLETDRNAEVKRRVEEKIRDESRRQEYRAFCRIADKRVSDLDLTIKNCDTLDHASSVLKDMLHNGFITIEEGLKKYDDIFGGSLLEAFKDHVEMTRSLLFTIGDINYRKGRKIEEIEEGIKEAHIQHEMCIDSLNPQAKKFSEEKKKLLDDRDKLVNEVNELYEREKGAICQFEPTQQGLKNCGVTFKHPVDELEEYRLNTRSRMVEYKAMALGISSSKPVVMELEGLKHSLMEAKKLIQDSTTKALM